MVSLPLRVRVSNFDREGNRTASFDTQSPTTRDIGETWGRFARKDRARSLNRGNPSLARVRATSSPMMSIDSRVGLER